MGEKGKRRHHEAAKLDGGWGYGSGLGIGAEAS